MASLIIIIITTFFLLLNAFTFLPIHSQNTPPTSLILRLTLSKTSLPPPEKQPKTISSTQTTSSSTITAPLRSIRDGYLIPLNIGTPPQQVQVYLDTGSDLTWVPCGNLTFDCIDCDDYYKSTLAPKSFGSFTPSLSSTSYRDTCGSRFCSDVHSSDSSLDPCIVSGCSLTTVVKSTCPRPCPSFAYTYGASGVVAGSLTRDTLHVHVSNNSGNKEVQKFCFGCVGSTYREPIGIAGFGKGPLSLPSQLGFDGKEGFSHCFLLFKYANNPNVSSTLLVREASLFFREGMHFTPMLSSSVFPNYYYVGLEAISIVGTNTTAPSASSSNTGGVVVGPDVPLRMREFDSRGNGGMLIDSGTTYTHLPEPFYSDLLTMLRSVIWYPRATADVEERVGFDLCYRVPISNVSNSIGEVVGSGFPGVTFHFMNNASVAVGEENLFQAVETARNGTVVKCLMMESMEEEEEGDGPAGVFGSFQQQNVEVVYDLDKERIGFRAMDCASQGLFHDEMTKQ